MAAPFRWRKLGLVLHVVSSVGWLGAAAAVAALAIAGLVRPEEAAAQAAGLAIEVATRWAVSPLAVAALLTGLLQAWISPWGLLRYWWVVFKLVLSLLAMLILYLHMQGFGPGAAHAGAGHDPRTAARLASSLLHSAGGIGVLLVNVVLSVYKPKGTTPWARRPAGERAGTGPG